MVTLLRMPEVATDAAEALLAEWLLAEGASFAAGDALATVETDKALVDIEAESGGTVLRFLVQGGHRATVGAPIAVLADIGEQVDDLGVVLARLGVDQETEPGAATQESREPDGDAARQARVTAGETDGVIGRDELTTPRRVFSSPLARKLARDAGLALENIPGTGPRNRVLRRDVDAAVAARAGAAPVADATHLPVGTPQPVPAGYVEIPHTRLRQAIASRLQQSKRDAPHFYLRATVRADRLLALRAELNEDGNLRISVNDLVIKAVAGAHVRVPEMNATWTDDVVRRPHTVDIAVAVATERGLVTPVIRDVARMSVTTLAAQVRDMASRARDGRLKQDDLEGGTITVTNLGMYGVEEFAAIINPPHASILAIGAVREVPVVVDGALAVRKAFKVTLSVDHRPVDGVVAAQWLRTFVELVESPSRALA